MLELALAGLAWTALHFVVAGPLRPALAQRTGEHGFRLVFSLLSFASLGWPVFAWRTAPVVPLFPGNPWLPLALMPVACVLLTAAARPSNPTSVAGQVTLGGRWAPRGTPSRPSPPASPSPPSPRSASPSWAGRPCSLPSSSCTSG